MNTTASRLQRLLLAVALCTASLTVLADAAGTVIKVSGKATALDNGNKSRELASGAAVNEGDTISTPDGSSIQLQMKDGALISLSGDSALNLLAYGMHDGKDLVRLIQKKGRFKTTTGNTPKDAYSMQTPSAIIRVRGTVYESQVNPANKETQVILREGKVLVESTCNDIPTGNQQLLEVPGVAIVITPCQAPGAGGAEGSPPGPGPTPPGASP